MAIKYLSNRVKDFKVGISNYSESKTSVSIIGGIGIGTADTNLRAIYAIGNAEVVGVLTATSIAGISGSFTSLNVTGITTFNDDVQFKGAAYNALWDEATSKLKFYDLAQATFGDGNDLQIYSDGTNGIIKGNDKTNIIGITSVTATTFYGDGSQLTGMGITGISTTGTSSFTNLNVSGVSTFTGNIDANGNLDVDGQTDLDVLNVSDTATFAGNVDIADTIYHTGDSNTKIRFPEPDTITFHTSGDERFRINSIGDVNISGTTTTGNLSVTGIATIGQLYVTGITTLAGNIDLGMGGDDDINVNGNFISGLVPKNNDTYDLGTTGKYWKHVYVSDTVVTNQINATGVSTFASAKVSNLTSGRVVLAGVGGELEDSSELTFNGNYLNIAGAGLVVAATAPTHALDIQGISTFSSHVYISGVTTAGIITGATYYGDGSNLTGTGIPGITTAGTSNFENINVTGVSTLGGTVDVNGYLDVGGQARINGITTFYNTLASNFSTHGSVVMHGGLGVSQMSNFGDGLNVIGHTEVDNLNVSGVSTFAGDINANGNIIGDNSTNISGINSVTATTLYGTTIAPASGALTIQSGVDSGRVNITSAEYLVLNASQMIKIQSGSATEIHAPSFSIKNEADNETMAKFVENGSVFLYHDDDEILRTTSSGITVTGSAKFSDLTDNRIVIAGTDGELEDTTKLTFDGTTLTIVGDASFSGNVTVGGTLTSEDKTNIDSLGIVTARTGVRVDSGGLIVTSGISTFDAGLNIDGDIVLDTPHVLGFGPNNSCGYIYHSSSNLMLTNVVGDVYLTTSDNDKDIKIQTDNGSGGLANYFLADGSTGEAILYHYGTERIKTSGSGAIVTGVLTATSFSGDGSNLTGITTSGMQGKWNPDSQYNLYAGTKAGDSSDADTCYNIGIGFQALELVNEGDNNIAIGCDAGRKITSGKNNIMIGENTGSYQMDTGCWNVLLGYEAGYCHDSGHCNVFIGSLAGKGHATSGGTGSDNVVIGSMAGCCLTSGSANIILGKQSGVGIQTGIDNVMIGRGAAQSHIDGQSNIFLGDYVAKDATTGSYNIFFGADTGRCHNGSHNLFMGHKSGYGSATLANNTGQRNIALGVCAGYSLVSGTDNVFLGTCAGAGTTTGVGFIAIGQNALLNEDHNSSGGVVAIGCNALCNQNASAGMNVAVGLDAGKRVTDSSENVFLGWSAGGGITSGSGNVALGALTLNTTSTGTYNVAIGMDAGRYNTGSSNVIIGAEGAASGSGSNNTFLGYRSGSDLTNGCYNTFLGAYSGCAITTGCYNVVIGYGATTPSPTDNNQLSIGLGSTSWIVGNGNWNVGIGTTNPDATVGAGNTAKLSVGIVSAYQLYGDGTNLTGVGGGTLISGITVQEEGTNVGTGGSITTLNFCGGTVTAAASGANTAIITVTSSGSTDGWIADADQNLVAGGQSPGANLDGTNACFNNLIGAGVGHCITSGKGNVMLGKWAGYYTKTGEYNTYFNYSGSNREDGDYNVAIGLYALKGSETAADNTGSYNIALGKDAGCRITSGAENIALGRLSMGAGTVTGGHNISIGCKSGENAAGACANIFLGTYSGNDITSGGYNVILGHWAGAQITGGGDNVAIGRIAMGAANVTGTCNVFLGTYAGCKLTSGTSNIAIGQASMGSGTVTGSRNVVIGCAAGMKITSALNNVVVGTDVACCLTSGALNIALGYQAGKDSISIGHRNIVIGKSAEVPITSGTDQEQSDQLVIGCESCNWIVGNASFNVGIGTTNPDIAVGAGNTAKLSVGILSAYQLYGDGSNLTGAGFSPDDQGNLVAGTGAGAALDADTYCNVIIGKDAGSTLNSGDYNVFLGFNAGKASTSNSGSVSIGQNAGQCMCGFSRNIFIGENAGSKLCRGSANIAIGADALCGGCSSGEELDYTIAIGCQAAKNLCEGADNVFIGKYVGLGITISTNNVMIGQCAGAGAGTSPGTSNIFIGPSAGCDITTGGNNLYMGSFAGANIESGSFNVGMGRGAGQAQTTGSSNVFLGRYSGNTVNTGNTNIAIGCYAGCASFDVGGTEQVAIGFGARNHLSGKCLAFNSWETTIAGVATVYSATGIVSATKFCGDGSALTNVGGASTDAWVQDSQGNLFAGTAAGASRDADTCFNIGIGQSAGKALNEGDSNIFLGCSAAPAVTSGSGNLAIGERAGELWQTASQSIAIGYRAAAETGTASNNNIMIGTCAGRSVSGHNNVFIGRCVAQAAHYGSSAVFIGAWAGTCNQSGENTYVGGGSGYYNKGQFNTLLGYYAGAKTCGSYCSTWIGAYTGCGANSCAGNTGDCNVGMGNRAGRGITSGHSVVMIGNEAGCNNSTGSQNVYLGQRAAYHGETGSCNVAIGNSVFLPITNGDSQLVIGVGSSLGWINGNANMNVGIGTTNPDIAVGVGNTAKLSVGIVSAYMLYGCGANLTGIDAGWEADAQENLYAGNGAGQQSDADTCFNIAVGYEAGKYLNEGDRNVFLGCEAGKCTDSGIQNVAIGKEAGKCTTGGGCNVSLGNQAGFKITTGSGNVAIGPWTMSAGPTTGDRNVAIGQCAGWQLGSGASNFFGGYCTGYYATTAKCNVMIGHAAGYCRQFGCYNIAFGKSALRGTSTPTNNSGNHNIGIGNSAGLNVKGGAGNIALGKLAMGSGTVTGDNNVVIGQNAGCVLTSGTSNVFVGCDSGKANTTGCGAVFIGCNAGCNNVDGEYSIIIGAAAGITGTAICDNIIIGREAGYDGTLTGKYNVLLGMQSGCQVTSGEYNTLLGHCSGTNLTSGADNVIVGRGAGQNGTITGNQNTFIGSYAGKSLTSGARNIAIGRCSACNLQTGSDNILAGWFAGKCLGSGNYNVLLGYRAATNVTGTSNVAVGPDAALFMQGGNYNIAMGYYALRGEEGDANGGCNIGIGCHSGNDITDGGNNVFIGNRSGDNVTTGCCNVIIGHKHPAASATGNTQFSIGVGSTSWVQGDSSYNITVNTICATNFNSTSDIRLKTNIQSIGDPIGKVKQIEGVSFNWKKDNKPALGVIADQVQEILPELVHGDDPKTVNYNGLIGLLIETVKEQQNQIDELNERISKLE